MFIIELPTIAKAQNDCEPRHLPPSPTGANASLRLLIVEDHADTARVLRRLLTSSGHAVMMAGTVAGALSLLDEHCLDVVLSDLSLPAATGYDLMKQIKQKHGSKAIAMSGFGMEEDISKSEAAGFSHHLVKPVNLARLEQTIRMVTAGV